MKQARLVTLIPVRKMTRAIRFYTKVLGGKVVYRGTGSMRNFWASLTVGGADVWLVAPSRPERRKLAYHALLVKNIRVEVRQLLRHRVTFQRAERSSPQSRIEGPIAIEPWGSSAFFKDSEGNLLMLWQNDPPM